MSTNLIQNIATYLEAQHIGTQGEDIFVGRMPDDDDNAIMLDQTGGAQPDRDLPIDAPTVQVTVRNSSYLSGLDKATAIYNLLHQKGDDLVLDTGGVDVMVVEALANPQHLGEDDSGRHIFTCNFMFKLRR